MDTPITSLLTLHARDGRVSGVLTQSGTLYAVEFEEHADGGFELNVDNKANGQHSHVRHLDTLPEAVTSAYELMGALAHNPFPGFEPAEEN